MRKYCEIMFHTVNKTKIIGLHFYKKTLFCFSTLNVHANCHFCNCLWNSRANSKCKLFQCKSYTIFLFSYTIFNTVVCNKWGSWKFWPKIKSDHAGYSPQNSLAACSYLSVNRVGFLAILISTHSSQNEIKCWITPLSVSHPATHNLPSYRSFSSGLTIVCPILHRDLEWLASS